MIDAAASLVEASKVDPEILKEAAKAAEEATVAAAEFNAVAKPHKPLSKMRKSALVEECTERGISSEGTVPELRSRLRQARKEEDSP